MTESAIDADRNLENTSKPSEKADTAHFGGPLGARLFIVGLPLLTLYLWICIHKHGGELVLPSLSVAREVPVPTGRALVACGGMLVAMSDSVPFSPEGNAEVDAQVSLPASCLAPVIFFAGDTGAGARWFAVTGF